MERTRVTLYNAQQGHAKLRELWDSLKPWLIAGHRIHVEAKPSTRSTDQNSRMWLMLTEVSKHVEWYGHRLTPDEWKTMFTASLRVQKTVPGLEGGFVVLGSSTSKMTVAEMCELQELIEAFAVQRGVNFPWIEEETC